METLRSRQVYANRWMSVREDDVRRADLDPAAYLSHRSSMTATGQTHRYCPREAATLNHLHY